MKLAIIGALILVVLLAGTVMAAVSWRLATASNDATETMRILIAKEHDRVCSKSLRYDSQLAWAAQWKTQDMAYRGYFSHLTLDGKYTRNFYKRVGIKWTYGTGEILHWDLLADPIESAKFAFTSFMHSSSHRVVIQNCSYDNFGVGTFKGHGGAKYYAVEFTDTEK